MSRLNHLLKPRSVLGFCIIVFALLLIMDSMGVSILHRILGNWPLALIIFGVAILYGPEKSENHTAPYILIGLGIFIYLQRFGLFNIHWGEMFVPIILLIIGYHFLKPHLRKSHRQVSDENNIDVFSILGGGEFNTRSDNLGNGHVVCILGGADIDIREADMEGDVIEIDILAFMGGAEIKVPLHWQVSVKAIPLLGGVSNQTTCMAERLQLPKKTLIVSGLAIMGGIDVRN